MPSPSSRSGAPADVVGERIVAAPHHHRDKLPVVGRAGEQEGGSDTA